MTRNRSEIWMEGVHAGYDPKRRDYRSHSGKKLTREQAVLELQADLRSMGQVGKFQRDRASRAAEQLENLIAGGYSPFKFRGRPTQPDLMPGSVASAYSLSEFYYNSEGDLAAAVETPIMVAMRDLDIKSPSKSIKRDLETLYDVDGLHMKRLLQDMWLSMGVYSIAHVYEVWEGEDLVDLILLPPRFTHVGNEASDAYGIYPLDGSAQWTREALKSQVPKTMYDQMSKRMGDVSPPGRILDLHENIRTVRGLDQRWKAYPKVLFQGAARAISTRIVYEEMRRAIYEGFRHQLWAFLLGDNDNKPSPAMMDALNNVVNGMVGERTGSLTFWGALRIEVLSPKTDPILKSEEWWMLSLDIYRRLGMSMRAMTGNGIQGERSGSDFEIDLDLMLEKFEFMRQGLLDYERLFRLGYAKRTDPDSKSALEAMRKTKVRFSIGPTELRKAIKDRLIPLFSIGVLSPQSLLSQAGQDYETELANKKEIQSAGEESLWFAPPTYNQTFAGEGGSKSTAVTNTGLSKNGTKPSANGKNPVSAQNPDEAELERKKREYLALILAAFIAYHETDPARFIEELKLINANRLDAFADLGYRRGGGAQEHVPSTWRRAAAMFVNSFADEFGIALKNRTGRMDYQRRALMYGEEGYRTAYLQGLQAALAEHGATHWRRVLHPEASATGPCPLCVADAETIHLISEPFMTMHPNDVCTAAPLHVQFSLGEGASEIGIPGITENQFSALVRELGPVADNIRRT